MIIGIFVKFVFDIFDSEKSSGAIGMHHLEIFAESPYNQIRIANKREPCISILWNETKSHVGCEDLCMVINGVSLSPSKFQDLVSFRVEDNSPHTYNP